ncbi:MAG: ROK family protein [Acidimicrobiales bacterium]
MARVLAVDIGGTKLAAAVVDRAGGVMGRASTPTLDGQADAADGEALFGALTTLVDKVRATAAGDVVACGVGCGGPMSPGGALVSPLNIAQWRSFPLRDRLAAHLGLPTFVDNDAKALTIGEGWIGAARGEHNYLGMVVSTGVGGGIVVDGRLLDGASTNAGHIGHVIVEPGGRQCGCGARGCLEAEASGSAIRAITGQPAAQASAAVRERTGLLVGRAVGSVLSLLDLRLVVIAGSVALGFGAPFFAAAQREVDAICQIEFARGARVLPAGSGELAPLVGAAAVAWRGLGHRVTS